MKKTGVFLLTLFLLTVIPPLAMHSIQKVKAQKPPSRTLLYALTKCEYTYSLKNLDNWYALKINRTTLCDSHTTTTLDYVGFNKGSRGDIGFTYNGQYVARLIPIVTGKINGNWWLVPLRNVPTISHLGFENTTNFLEIFYNGSGSFTAYQYDNYAVQTEVALQIHRVGIKLNVNTAECKISADVSRIGGDLDDTGFGFLFFPTDFSKFKYAKFMVANQTRTVELTNIEKISGADTFIEFLGSQRLGITWNWHDLYELGSHVHFEVVEFAGLVGLLTGSYGYGSGSRISVDPTLTVSASTSEYSIINTWTEEGSTVGYNFTITDSAMKFSEIYNYYSNSWQIKVSADDGLYVSVQEDDVWGTKKTPEFNVDSFTLLYNTSTRISFRLETDTESWEGSTVKYFWTITCHAYTPIIFVNSTLYCSANDTNGITDMRNHYVMLADEGDAGTNNGSFEWDYDADLSDDVVTANSSIGGLAFWSGDERYNGGSRTNHNWITNTDTSSDNLRIFHDVGIGSAWDMTTGETWEIGFAIVVHNETSKTAAVNYIDDFENEIADSWASISSINGLTYTGRNNQTGSYDFSHSSGNNGQFTFSPVDSESNFTDFHITGWNNNNYQVHQNNTLLTEDIDYKGSVYSSDLNLLFLNPVAASDLQVTVAPTMNSFQSPATVYSDESFSLYVTINDVEGVADFLNCTATLDDDGGHSFSLKWLNNSNSFSEDSDPSNFCTLQSGTRTTVNATAYKLTWTFLIRETFPEGTVDVVGQVFDTLGNTGTVTNNDLFTFSHSQPGQYGSSYTPPSETTEDNNETVSYTPPGYTPSPGQQALNISPVIVVCIIAVGIVIASAYTQTSNLKGSRKQWKQKKKKDKSPKWTKKKKENKITWKTGDAWE